MTSIKGKITKNELSPALLEELMNNQGGAGGNGGSLAIRKYTQTITSNTNKVNIGSLFFTKETDELLVFLNSVYLEEETDYIINEDNSISKANGSEWRASEEIPANFNFVCLMHTADEKLLHGSKIIDSTIAEAKLDEDLRRKINSRPSDTPNEKPANTFKKSIKRGEWNQNREGLFSCDVVHNLFQEIYSIMFYSTESKEEVNFSYIIKDDSTITVLTIAPIDADIIMIGELKVDSGVVGEHTHNSLIPESTSAAGDIGTEKIPYYQIYAKKGNYDTYVESPTIWAWAEYPKHVYNDLDDVRDASLIVHTINKQKERYGYRFTQYKEGRTAALQLFPNGYNSERSEWFEQDKIDGILIDYENYEASAMKIGTKKFIVREFLPYSNNSYSIGEAGKVFQKVYTNAIYAETGKSAVIYPGTATYGGIEVQKDGYIRPTQDTGYSLGSANFKFHTLYAKTGTINTSDKKFKENIEYLNTNPDIATLEYDDKNINNNRRYSNYIKNLPFAKYDYKSNKEADKLALHTVGFIADDIVEDEISKEYIFRNDNGDLMYNTMSYTSIIGIALQEEIKYRELENKILQNKLDELEKKFKKLEDRLKAM